MTNKADIERLAKFAADKLGKVDILINNAGSNEPQYLDATTDEAWDRIVELNLSSCMRLSRAVVGGMKERRWGRLLFTSSIMGFASNPGRGAYSATKAALVGMVRAWAPTVRSWTQRLATEVEPPVIWMPNPVCT